MAQLFVPFEGGEWAVVKTVAAFVGGFTSGRELKDALMVLSRARPAPPGGPPPQDWVRDASPAEIVHLKALGYLGRNACRAQLCSREAVAELLLSGRGGGGGRPMRPVPVAPSPVTHHQRQGQGAGPRLPGVVGDDVPLTALVWDPSAAPGVIEHADRTPRPPSPERGPVPPPPALSPGQVAGPRGAGPRLPGVVGDDVPLTALVWDPSAAPDVIEPMDPQDAEAIVAQAGGRERGGGPRFSNPEIEAFVAAQAGLAGFNAWYARSSGAVVLSRPGHVGTSSSHTQTLTGTVVRQVLFVSQGGLASHGGWRSLLSPACISKFVGFTLATGKQPATVVTYLERLIPLAVYAGVRNVASVGWSTGLQGWIKRICTHFRAQKKRKDRDTIVEMKERGG